MACCASGSGGKGPHRVRSKKRAFDKMFDSYSQEFKDAFNNMSRAQQTKIVNEGMQKGADGLYQNKVMENWALSETMKKSQQKEFAWMSDGVIQEEAEQRVGGAAKLAQGVQRGAIKVAHHGGVALYLFPSAKTKMSNSLTQDVGTKGDMLVDKDIHMSMKEESILMPGSADTCGAIIPTPPGFNEAISQANVSFPGQPPPLAPLPPMSSTPLLGPMPLPPMGSSMSLESAPPTPLQLMSPSSSVGLPSMGLGIVKDALPDEGQTDELTAKIKKAEASLRNGLTQMEVSC